MKELFDLNSKRAGMIFFWVFTVLLCTAGRTFSQDDDFVEPWGRYPRGEITKVWSSGTNADLDPKAPMTRALKAERIAGATAENSGGQIHRLAVTDSGYLFAHDAIRDCILRWNPKGEIDRVLYSEITKEEIESGLAAGGIEGARTLLGSGPLSSLLYIECRGETVYIVSYVGSRTPLPWLDIVPHEVTDTEPLLKHSIIRVADREGNVLSSEIRQDNWYEGYLPPIVDDRGNLVQQEVWEDACIFTVRDIAGLLLRRVYAGPTEESLMFMDPDAPIRVEIKPLFPGVIPERYKEVIAEETQKKRAAEEDKIRRKRQAIATDVAGEVLQGSPPFEVYYVPDLQKLVFPLIFKNGGVTPAGEILHIYSGNRFLYFPNEGPPRLENGPLSDAVITGSYSVGYRRGVIVLYFDKTNEFRFLTEQGDVLGQERPNSIGEGFASKIYVDGTWNMFFTRWREISPGMRTYTLYVYRPSKNVQAILKAAAR